MKFGWQSRSVAERRHIIELSLMIVVSLLLVSMSRLETRLLELSKSLSSHQDFFTSILYFGQINFNVILILVLAALIFRNIARLVVERRRGVIGSRLKTKLIISFVFFAGAPTFLMFYISYRFITDSFDTWFSVKVQETIQQTREAGAKVYRQDQRRVESLARIALRKITTIDPAVTYSGALDAIDPSGLEGFEDEYRLDEIAVYDVNGRKIWGDQEASADGSDGADGWSLGEVDLGLGQVVKSSIGAIIERFSDEPGLIQKGMVENRDDMDIVRGIAPIYDSDDIHLLGVVVAEEHFEAQILRSIESILSEFANLRPGAQLIRLSYIVLLVAMLFLILFAATWLGFYVAKAMTGPILELGHASKQVAAGNYEVTIPAPNDDETGQLIRQFNAMTADLRQHRAAANASASLLQHTNEELERRRNHMEIILNNINTGVVSVDSRGVVTSASSAGRELLQLTGKEIVGSSIKEVLPANLYEAFWCPIEESLKAKNSFNGQIEVVDKTRNLNLLVDARRFEDDAHNRLGVVVVFDDATERVRAQRVAAWREVARRIAHEIKNPITPIKLNAQRLRRRFSKQIDEADREVFDSCIQAILGQVESLKRMVNEFSKFSRMPTVLVKDEDLNEIVNDMMRLFTVSHPEVVFDLDDLGRDLPHIPIDREQIGRALINLFTNAIDAMGESEEKRIKVDTYFDARSAIVYLEISDSGPGFPHDIIDRVMEPYVSTKKEGTGLGLPIVNQIISEHGGYLRVRNSVTQSGAVISIQLPTESAGSSQTEDRKDT
jgi:two-component system, NtrC family, nitrogen regulation sensor histidine kinase NtrY